MRQLWRFLIVAAVAVGSAISARAQAFPPLESACPVKKYTKPQTHAKTKPTTPSAQRQSVTPVAKKHNLEDLIAAQQQQLDAQREQMEELKSQIQQLLLATQQANTAAQKTQSSVEQAQSTAAQAQQTAAQAQHSAEEATSNAAAATAGANLVSAKSQDVDKQLNALESPVALRYKGITITPGGYLAAETVWRRSATGSDINTPFNSIPFPGSSLDHLSEFYASGRQSRISALAEGKLATARLTGYVEADFLSAGVTSNNTQTNSYTLRQRQMWGQAALDNGWSFTGGQMWSLVTETKKGVDNRSEAPPMTIDPAFNVGFSWARQSGFRVSKDLGDKLWLAFSVENAQTTVGGEGSTNNFLIGAAGTSGGLYNPSATYAFNPMPDLIGKVVFQPNNISHIEVFGVISRFRDRVFPGATSTPATAVGAFNDASMGGGAGANVRVNLLDKHLDAGLHFLGGEGVGRYGDASLPDVLVRADGILVPIRSYQALGTLEYHAKIFDVYSYVGGEYAGRNSLSTTTAIGYGSPLRSATGCYSETVPGTSTTGQFPVSTTGFLPGALSGCNVDTRDIFEGTAGVWYRFYSGPKGKIQWGPQFSYVLKNTWSGVGGTPSASEPMIFTSFRYYLP